MINPDRSNCILDSGGLGSWLKKLPRPRALVILLHRVEHGIGVITYRRTRQHSYCLQINKEVGFMVSNQIKELG